jgi:DNA-binding CsgD family transcriptional regulator
VRTITPGTSELLSGLVDGSATVDMVPTAVHAVAARSFVATVADPVTAQARSRDGGWITLHGWRLDDSSHVAVAVERSRSEAVATMLLEGYALSQRERQVARLVIAGYATHRIAGELFLSVHTVRDHLKSIFTKTGVHSRRELVAELSGHRG